MNKEDFLGYKISFRYEDQIINDVIKQKHINNINYIYADDDEIQLLTKNYGTLLLKYNHGLSRWHSDDELFESFFNEELALPMQINPKAATLEADDYTGSFIGRKIVAKNALDHTISTANAVIDDNPDTFARLGTNNIRYILHDFGGNFNLKKKIKTISWSVDSSIDKNYKIDYFDGKEWKNIGIFRSTTKSKHESASFSFEEPVDAYALRMYYLGNTTTSMPDVELTIAGKDGGSGVKAYRVSNYSNFRDDPAWIDFDGGIISKSWDMIPETDLWEKKFEVLDGRYITAMIVKDNNLILGGSDGSIWHSNDDNFVLTATLPAQINTFIEYGEDEENTYIYAGLADGSIYRSLNGTSWDNEYLFKIEHTEDPVDPRYGIQSFAVWDKVLYIGTDYNKLYKWDASTQINTPVLLHVFNDKCIDTMQPRKDSLLVGTSPSGIIFQTKDGTNYQRMINTPLKKWHGNENHLNELYFYGDRGTIYKYMSNDSGAPGGDSGGPGGDSGPFGPSGDIGDLGGSTGPPEGPGSPPAGIGGAGTLSLENENFIWQEWYDSAAKNITASKSFMRMGPNIKEILLDTMSTSGASGLPHGVFIYAISYVDFDGEETLIGTPSNILTTLGSKANLSWNKINNANFYRIYRTANSNQDMTGIGLLADEIYETEFIDDGSIIVNKNKKPSSNAKSYLWFGTDSSSLYVYDNETIIFIQAPENMDYISGIETYNGYIYISGYNEDKTKTFVHQYSSPLIGGGTKRVYLQMKDNAGNISSFIYDDIIYDILMQSHIIEIDVDGEIQFYYKNPTSNEKFVSARKELYQIGEWISEEFYSSSLSRWDEFSYLIYLERNTKVEFYLRTADTIAELQNKSWTMIKEEIHDGGALDGYLQSGIIDISIFKGKWIQFKTILKTSQKNNSPRVYNVTLSYICTEGVFFFSTLFNVEELALNNYDTADDILMRRGVLVYNGAAPPGGKITFAITTNPDSFQWQDYTEITPNRIFELTPKAKQFRIGILLVSTDSETAVVHEWALMFDAGTYDIIDVEGNL